MAGIKDVARRAGVGVGTVSRALNGSGYISEEKRKKILEAAKALDYQPNELAKNLYRNKTYFIGIMMPELEHPFFSSLLEELELELYRYGYKCMVCSTKEINSREQEFLEMLKRNVMDGIIACVDTAHPEDQSIERPIVALERNWGGRIPLIHSDHEQGGLLAADAMYRAGCRKILHFRTDGKGAPFEKRHQVFREVLELRDVEVIDVEVDWDQMSYRYNQETSGKYMEQYPEVDGIFATDVLALGCMAAAARTGRRVPDDLQVLAYDGTGITGLVWPALSCVRQNLPGLAKAAVGTMIQILEGRPAAAKMVIPVEYQEGGTLRKPRMC